MAGPTNIQPKPNPPPRAYPSMSRPRRRPHPLRCLCISLLVLIILLGIAVLITWLVVRPKPLEYAIDDAKVHGFNLTADNALNATFDLVVRSYNRNHKVALWYDSIDVTVWYDRQMVAFVDPEPFFQPTRNVTIMYVSAVAPATPLMASVARNLKRDRSGAEVRLVVKVEATIRFKVGSVKSKHYKLTAECSPVAVHFSATAPPFDRVYCDVDI